jgi:tight adherence protein B
VGLYQLLGGRNESFVKKRIKSEMELLSRETYDRQIDITRKARPLSDIGWLNELLSRIPLFHGANRLLLQSETKFSIAYFFILSLLVAVVVFFIVDIIVSNLSISIAAGLLAGIVPISYIKWKKSIRMSKFEKQLPDALDLIAKSLRAGHTFSSGLNMVAQEFDDPIAGEFRAVAAEINLGMGLDEALKALRQRVDCSDLRFLSVALVIQRETGGNLSLILEKIASLIRERFALQGRVKTLAAEGRLSMYILTAIPILFALLLSVVNPGFFEILLHDPIGKTLIAIAVCMMVVGYIVMVKLIKIKI